MNSAGLTKDHPFALIDWNQTGGHMKQFMAKTHPIRDSYLASKFTLIFTNSGDLLFSFQSEA